MAPQKGEKFISSYSLINLVDMRCIYCEMKDEILVTSDGHKNDV